MPRRNVDNQIPDLPARHRRQMLRYRVNVPPVNVLYPRLNDRPRSLDERAQLPLRQLRFDLQSVQ